MDKLLPNTNAIECIMTHETLFHITQHPLHLDVTLMHRGSIAVIPTRHWRSLRGLIFRRTSNATLPASHSLPNSQFLLRS
jgi:hypothetical protein